MIYMAYYETPTKRIAMNINTFCKIANTALLVSAAAMSVGLAYSVKVLRDHDQALSEFEKDHKRWTEEMNEKLANLGKY
jgi:hypothetical protein